MGHSDMWSYSRVSSYNQCPYQWYLEYVEHRDEKDSNWYAENGSNMHETLELIANGVLSIYDAGGYYLDLADCNFEPIRQSTKENTENQCVDFFSSYDFNYLKDYDVVATEEEVFFNIGEYKFHGFIDLHLKDKDGNHIVVDYKSAFNTLKKDGTPKKQNIDTWNGYFKQAYLYSEGIYQKYGCYPTKLAWLLFRDKNLIFRNFDSIECENTKSWVLETISKIENDAEFNPQKSFIMCSQLCDFRNTCEYKDEEEEDAEE